MQSFFIFPIVVAVLILLVAGYYLLRGYLNLRAAAKQQPPVESPRQVVTSVPLPAVAPALRPPVAPKAAAPTRPVHDANGHKYIPNDDGTYRNTTTHDTVTWLILYTLLSDAHRATYAPPQGYGEGTNPADAALIVNSQPEVAEVRTSPAADDIVQGTSADQPSPVPATPAPDASPSSSPDPSPSVTPPSNDQPAYSPPAYDSSPSFTDTSTTF